TIEEVSGMVTASITGDDADVWFAMIYIAVSDGGFAVLTGCSGIPAATPLSPLRLDLGAQGELWGLREVAAGGAAREAPTPSRQAATTSRTTVPPRTGRRRHGWGNGSGWPETSTTP